MTAIGAVLVKNQKVINSIVVDTSDGIHVNGYTPPDGATVHILPFGSQVTMGWDFVDNDFYAPLPTHIELRRGGNVEIPYQVTGTYLDGVSLSGTTMSAASTATLGDFTVTLSDPTTSRSSECVISVKDTV